MKLVKILALNLKKWHATTSCYTQDKNGSVYPWEGGFPEFKNGYWSGEFTSAHIDQDHLEEMLDAELASDHSTAIITRADWEAERARIKGETKVKPKANKDGWLRHRGGKCPVEAGMLVDVRHRDGEVFEGVEIGKSRQCSDWTHTDEPGDIMAWRPHKAEQVIVSDTSVLTDGLREPQMPAAKYFDGPLQWRDRILELDAEQAKDDAQHKIDSERRAAERAEMVAKLKAEGLALVQAEDSQQEDMSDWRNWKPGDLVEIIDPESSELKKGQRYPILQMDFEENAEEDGMFMPCLLEGSSVWLWMKNMKWHSRPSK